MPSLAMEEAVVNIIDYAYQPRDHKAALLMADQNGEKFFMSPILRGHEQSLS